MKRTAFLDQHLAGGDRRPGALAAALRDGTIAGAARDVFEAEPLPVDDPLRGLPNTVLTPHTGYVVEQCYEVFYREIVEDIAAWQAGTPIRTIRAR